MAELIDLEIEERFQSSCNLKMVMPVNDPKANVLVDEILEVNGQQFYVTEVIGDRDQEKGVIEAHAEDKWMRLADIKKPGTHLLTASPENGVLWILAHTGWVATQMTEDETLYTLEVTDPSVLDWLWQWAKITGNEIQFEPWAQTLSFIPTIGSVKPYAFRYGRNMHKIKRTVTAVKATRLYAYGKREEDVITTLAGHEYIEDYSYYTNGGMTLEEAQRLYRKDEIFVDDSISDPVILHAVAVRRLAILAQPGVKYEADVVDLTSILGEVEGDYRCGDSVFVYDDLLRISEMARVTRTLKYPNEPHRNKVELTFGTPLLPDTNASTSRDDRQKQWELFESNNRTTLRSIGGGTTILNRLAITTTTGTEWVVGYSFHGVGVGSGTLHIEPTNDDDGQPLWPPVALDFVDGQDINFHFSYGEDEIPAAEPVLVIRAFTTGGSVTVPERGTQFWILARGAVQRVPTLANSITFEYTGAVQHWTVPDDVGEIQIDCRGSDGRSAGAPAERGGHGGRVSAKFGVGGGLELDIYVGGYGVSVDRLGGWPNGGNGGNYTTDGGGGGGSSDVRAAGAAFASTWIVAAGGGGAGAFQYPAEGGDGGFMSGENGMDNHRATGGGGASQVSFGANGAGLGPYAGLNGTDGDFGGVQGQGGHGYKYDEVGNINGLGSGGGGGGWHGGGGGGEQFSGGGGGSGWVSAAAYDVDYEDGENDALGTITISWNEVDDT